MTKILTIMIFLMFGIIGCGMFNVSSNNLVGTWVMTDESKRYIPPNLNKISTTLVLNADGTFVASNVPYMVGFYMPKGVQFLTGSGDWKLKSQSDGQQLVLLNFNKLDKDQNASFRLVLGVSNNLFQISLNNFLGDPDELRRLEFIKVKQ